MIKQFLQGLVWDYVIVLIFFLLLNPFHATDLWIAVQALAFTLVLKAIWITVVMVIVFTVYWYKRRQIMKNSPYAYLYRLQELADKYPPIPMCDFCRSQHELDEPHVFPNGYGYSHRKKDGDL